MLAGAAALGGCATPPPPAVACGPASVWLLDRGWHTEIAFPVAAIAGPLADMPPRFPDARTLLFGFGKRSFMTSPARDLGEWIAGPIPGDGVVQVIGWRVTPAELPGRPAIGLYLPPDGLRALADFISATIARDAEGAPALIGSRLDYGSVFYAATRGYSLGYTCNTWTAAALDAAGLPVTPDGVVVVSDVLRQVVRLPVSCRNA